MDSLHIILLAIVQGITEFLPISSSAHLIMLPEIFSWQDQGLSIDIILHFGSLLAVMLYFHKDVAHLWWGFVDLIRLKKTFDNQLFTNVLVATLPVLAAGFILKEIVSASLRNPLVIGMASIIFALLLYKADQRAEKNVNSISQMTSHHALLIGLSQVLALCPGVSRSGITMTASLFLGYSRVESAKFSLLISIPTILAASLLISYEIYALGNLSLNQEAIIAGFLAFIVSYSAILLMLRWLKRFTFLPFVIYRIGLGLVIIIFFMIAS
ncbi:MAG: undecaprenyl-diphosphate phosphatase [SAR324 cluster bacterium]|nr:undecaprenyl-diphosphate phosphatase [SAR324 cluster bacterium]